VCRWSTFLAGYRASVLNHALKMLQYSNYREQWRSQALKSGWAQGVWGTEVPGRRSMSGAPVGVWRRRPQKPDIYRQFAAVKCFSTPVCCRVRPPFPLPPKNSSDLHEYHDPPSRPGRVGTCPLLPTRGYTTDREQVCAEAA